MVFRQLSESQLKDAKLKIMAELHKTNARLLKFNQHSYSDSLRKRRTPRMMHGGLQRKNSVKSTKGRGGGLGLIENSPQRPAGRRPSLGLGLSSST